MKIVHVICGLEVGGAELMLADIMEAQCRQGHQVTLMIINDRIDRGVAGGLSPEINKIFVGRPQGSKNPWWILKYNVLLRRQKAEVVHFHDDNALGMTFRDKRKKYIFTVHDEKLDLKYLKKADIVCAISSAVRDDLRSRYNCEATIVYNGIKIKEISTTKPPETMPPLRIVQVSRLDHAKKGQDLLIEAVARLVTRGFDIKVDFIGEGASSEYLKQLADSNGLTDAVSFLGKRSRQYIYSHLGRYHLFVQPSRKEGFGLTIAEAMAAGVPVLVSDIAGPREVVGEGKYGEMFECGNRDALEKAIEHIYNEYDSIIRQAGDHSTAYCRQMFDIENTATNYIRVYGL